MSPLLSRERYCCPLPSVNPAWVAGGQRLKVEQGVFVQQQREKNDETSSFAVVARWAIERERESERKTFMRKKGASGYMRVSVQRKWKTGVLPKNSALLNDKKRCFHVVMSMSMHGVFIALSRAW
jgi:hypothetical protein